MHDVNFTIILPTYNRPNTVSKSIDSVLKQTYGNRQLLVIIDDEIEKYKSLIDTYKNEGEITFLKNPKNLGKNQSLNHALDHLKNDNFKGFIIFLDDDDWLNPECLKDFTVAITKNPEIKWFVSERANADTKQPYTINKTDRNLINYEADMLLRRKFTGDTTQCLYFETFNKIRFSTLIKNAEEWLYFAEIAKMEKNFLFLPVIGTYSIGYATDGLTYNYHNKKESWKNNFLVLKELRQRELFSLPIIIYFTVRLLKSLIK